MWARGARRLSALISLLALAGCGAEAPAPGGFRVALLTPGSINDGGWNAGAYQGLLRIRDELGAEVRHVETRTPAEFDEGFRDFASRGFALVFGHGFEYQEAAARAGAEFPGTIFVTTSGNTVRANVAPMVFELEQATYLCGVLAARTSESGVLGLVGGIDLPSIRSTFVAFRAGALRVRPHVQVRDVFLGNFDDVPAAREAALALLDQGADRILHQANDAGRGVFRAVEERAAQGRRVRVFGTNANQNAMAPSVVLGSATLDIPGALLAVAKRVQEGRFRSEPLRLGMREGVVALVLNPELAGEIPEPVRAELAELEAQIRAGTLAVPRGDF
jgi:basic membrane lipoprotein Med (substrate-binding protein (PBP1-ABC) superfamily)